MDFIPAAILSGIAYDCLKNGTALTAQKLKEKLREWLISDEIATAVSQELGQINLTDEMSESLITKKIESSPSLMTILSEIKRDPKINIVNQYHSGSGDNVARDKIVK